MSFVLTALAVLLTLLGVACIAYPLLTRDRVVDGEVTGSTPIAAGVAALVIGAGAVLLYAAWSNWAGPTPMTAGGAAPGTPDEMVGGLARRLERNPDDLQGWVMLGRSHTALGQYPLAARAYQRADRLASGKNVEALTGWAEALVLADDKEIEGRAGRLFEKALEIDARAPKALFFGAVAAQRRGALPLARERFKLLLDSGAPAEIRPALEQQVAAIDAQLAAAAGGTATTAAAAESAATVTVQGPGPANARVALRISLAPGLAQAATAAKALFVSARTPGRPGPPLAAKRLGTSLPLDIELTEADAMIAGRGIVAGTTVEVVARLSLSGTANPQAGDPVGRLRYDVGKDGVGSLVIDQLTP